jgi:hypothetical protein
MIRCGPWRLKAGAMRHPSSLETCAQKKTRRWKETARLLGCKYEEDKVEPSIIRGSLAERWADKPIAEIDAHAVAPGRGADRDGPAPPGDHVSARVHDERERSAVK